MRWPTKQLDTASAPAASGAPRTASRTEERLAEAVGRLAHFKMVEAPAMPPVEATVSVTSVPVPFLELAASMSAPSLAAATSSQIVYQTPDGTEFVLPPVAELSILGIGSRMGSGVGGAKRAGPTSRLDKEPKRFDRVAALKSTPRSVRGVLRYLHAGLTTQLILARPPGTLLCVHQSRRTPVLGLQPLPLHLCRRI